MYTPRRRVLPSRHTMFEQHTRVILPRNCAATATQRAHAHTHASPRLLLCCCVLRGGGGRCVCFLSSSPPTTLLMLRAKWTGKCARRGRRTRGRTRCSSSAPVSPARVPSSSKSKFSTRKGSRARRYVVVGVCRLSVFHAAACARRGKLCCSPPPSLLLLTLTHATTTTTATTTVCGLDG